MKKVTGAFITGFLFAGLIFALRIYDVAPIGPAGTEIGFSTFNKFVHDWTGVNMIWYTITDFFGYAAIGVCALFALAGLVQMIKRRSLFKVDREILALGVLFAVVIGCYVLFEKVIINYRPVIMPGETAPEASFPSSHTMLIMTVMVTLVTVAGRLYCGVHWCTDIIGGILLSTTLLLLFSAVVSAGRERDDFRIGPYRPKHGRRG